MSSEFILELKVLFGFGKWYKVFDSYHDAVTHIPNNKSILVHLGKTEICLARNETIITAFLNECPHNQMPLNRGFFNEKKEWICPYHRHCFNVSNGDNLTMPETGKLKLFQIKISKNGLYVYKDN
ncbi:MAG TPA: Rieske 2Fe-2S domain-containing protein [Bacteroidia bacterium]|nr:Rieske 2Fe-2S domain-containing protein [Bacteroidia bacterium]